MWLLDSNRTTTFLYITHVYEVPEETKAPHPRSRHRIIVDSYLCIKHELEQKEEAMKEWEERMSKE